MEDFIEFLKLFFAILGSVLGGIAVLIGIVALGVFISPLLAVGVTLIGFAAIVAAIQVWG